MFNPFAHVPTHESEALALLVCFLNFDSFVCFGVKWGVHFAKQVQTVVDGQAIAQL